MLIKHDERISDNRWLRLLLSSGENMISITLMNIMMEKMLMTVLVKGLGNKFAYYWECNWRLLHVYLVGVLDFIFVIFIIILINN